MMSEGDAISQLERFFLPAYAQADAGQTGPDGLPLDLKFAACPKGCLLYTSDAADE